MAPQMTRKEADAFDLIYVSRGVEREAQLYSEWIDRMAGVSHPMSRNGQLDEEFHRRARRDRRVRKELLPVCVCLCVLSDLCG
jgi:hypothetical protein